MIGIIGGTGFYGPDFLARKEKIEIETRYGDCEVFLGMIGRERVVFLPRHGVGHEIPPHMVNYRKNISAIQLAGAERIISINSVGSLDKKLVPGGVVVPHDFIDLTKGRESTFYDNEAVHIDMSEAYCPEIRETLISCAGKFFENVFKEGVYICTEGPRFETPTEVKMLRQLGGDVVGMVGLPEAVLAREAGLCYASIGSITNHACGISKNPLTVSEVKAVAMENIGAMQKTISCAVQKAPKKRGCRCADSISEAKV